MPKAIARRLAGAVGPLALVAAVACGGEEQAAAPPSGTAAAPQAASAPAEVAPAERHRTESGRDVALPEGFPPDVPIHPGATAVVSSSVPDEGILVSFESKDTPQAVFGFYKEKLVEQGWTVEGEMSSADQRMLIAGKGDRKASILVAGTDGEKTEVTLTLTDDES